ncbi:MAG: aminotransferase class V-fold PLP-dependent enzyme [Lachnospiraceae bacterium]
MKTIYERLKEYEASDYYGFHMPGHKRNKNMTNADLPYEIDITEIEGFDDLHHARGIIQEAELRAAQLYHGEDTHFLINGSTVGILSGILGATEKGGKIVVARNCHKSVYHAIFLNELEPLYVYPKWRKEQQLYGEIQPKEIETLLETEEGIQAVVIVSPTYDGVVSDVEKIAKIAHKKGIPLIVDEAHGAHFGFHPYFPQNANQSGADVVIHSLHKTLPSLTQTALIHLNGSVVNRERIEMYLHMLQSSSPSYVLMASMDQCMEGLQIHGVQWFDEYVQKLSKAREELYTLPILELVETEHFDKGKLIISTQNANISGNELYNMLWKQYHLQMEMSSEKYVLAMTSVADTQDGYERLVNALFEVDQTLSPRNDKEQSLALPKAEIIWSSAVMERKKRLQGSAKYLPWEEAQGLISTEYAYLYPPGCPLIVPGERITKEITACLIQYQKAGLTIEGLHRKNEIGVWENG